MKAIGNTETGIELHHDYYGDVGLGLCTKKLDQFWKDTNDLWMRAYQKKQSLTGAWVDTVKKICVTRAIEDSKVKGNDMKEAILSPHVDEEL